jgi:hypothetical protein
MNMRTGSLHRLQVRSVSVTLFFGQKETIRRACADGGLFQSMIRKSLPSGFDPMGGIRFSEKHALGLDPGDHAQTKSWSGMPIEPQLIPL